VNVQYLAGKNKKEVLLVLLEIDASGALIGLKSNKLSNTDIKKISKESPTLMAMDVEGVKKYLEQIVPSYRSALTTLRKGRWQIIQEFEI
jgi:hypothetical protein